MILGGMAGGHILIIHRIILTTTILIMVIIMVGIIVIGIIIIITLTMANHFTFSKTKERTNYYSNLRNNNGLRNYRTSSYANRPTRTSDERNSSSTLRKSRGDRNSDIITNERAARSKTSTTARTSKTSDNSTRNSDSKNYK